MNTIPDCFSCWHKKLFATVWTPIWYATFHSRDRVRIESWSLEKFLKLICPAFLRLGKSLEKWWRVLSFFQSYNQSALYVFFFVLVKSYSVSPVHLQCIMKKALFLHCLRTLLITYFDNLESGKRKSLKKSWILDPKICMSPVGNSSVLQFHSFAEITILMCELDYE